MTTLGMFFALLVEVLRLIRSAGSIPNAVAALKQVNDTFNKVDQAKTPEEYQDAAKAISELESDSS